MGMIPFLFALSGGMLVVLGTGRFEQIAWRFLRLCGFLTLALAALATGMALRDAGGWPAARWDRAACVGGALAAVSAAALALLAPLAPRYTRAFRFFCLLGGAAGIAGAGWFELAESSNLAVTHAVPRAFAAANWWPAINLMLGALLLGSITIAWLLGHAYLTATKMTIAPLRRFSGMLTTTVAIRVVFALASLTVGWAMHGDSFLNLLTNQWLVASLRGGLGLVAVAVFAWMVADCVRLRATQSATGILYFGSVFAYVGELASQYLTREVGWPL